ncbi:glycosyltransferase family 2 protein, partial [bacterium]|nr:glycosyltransferase family 2 protein [bacterium]
SIIIIDNCSTDSTIEKVKAFIQEYKKIFKDFILIQNCKNIGFGAGINQGANISNGEYLFILNPDTKVKEDSLMILLEYAIEDKECGVWEARQLPYEHPKFYDSLTLETIWSTGAAFLIIRKVFEEIGGFDEEYFLYAEDVDLSFKVRANGYCIRYIPEAVIWHFTKDEIKRRERLILYSIRNNLYLRWKFLNFKEILKGYIFLFYLLIASRTDTKFKKMINHSIYELHSKMFFKGILYRYKNIKKKLQFSSFIWNFEYEKHGSEKYGRWSFGYNLPNQEPKISILLFIPKLDVLNNFLLKDTIQSIYNQTYKNWNILLLSKKEVIPYLNLYLKGDKKIIEILLPSLKDNLSYEILQEAFGYLDGAFLIIIDNKIILYNTYFDMLLCSLNNSVERKILYSMGLSSKINFVEGKGERYLYNSLKTLDIPPIFLNKSIDTDLLISFKSIQDFPFLLDKSSLSLESFGIKIHKIDINSIYKVNYVSFEKRDCMF